MSYAGAVADMVRKMRENRELQKSIRNNFKARKLQALNSSTHQAYKKSPKLSPEELAKMRRDIRIKMRGQRRRNSILMLIGLSAFLGLSLYLLSLFF